MDANCRRPSESRARPMQALATLPLFLTLDRCHVLIAGGSDAALWKAELVLAAGAAVTVAAPVADLSAGMMDFLEREDVVHRTRAWQPSDMDGVMLAIADLEEGEAARFAEAAKAAGAIWNVIDKPAHSQMAFGSIVNRSPVVIGISTGGAAPILGQMIRARIETLLPPALASWAALARRIRGRVAQTLPLAASRRRFWEALARRAFLAAPADGDDDALMSELLALDPAQARAGRVTLVGAGPGDAEHLTLKALRVLQAADVILFDDLVSDSVLELARREAKRMLVGKRGGRDSCRQEDINDLMVKLARQGKHVVRLKSGDPMIFGRAGEEIERLKAEGIPVEIVPGITSAIAMASALGVSLTHRDCARSVRFVTGHAKDGTLPRDIDWHALADPVATTIFYMGARTASGIATQLLEQGLDPATPVVVCAAISHPRQRHWRGSLDNLTAGVASIGLDDPVLIGIGAVFAKLPSQHAEALLPVRAPILLDRGPAMAFLN